MRAPYWLNIIDNCLTCPVREEHLFCNLSLPALEKLNQIKSTAIYPKSAMLFIEGQQSRGVGDLMWDAHHIAKDKSAAGCTLEC